jgi:ABC-2 type transport system ATP-binding protein
MLRVQNFQKRYNEDLILRIDKLELPTGIYWIKGENGSGKSTFFKSIAGLIPFEGTIEFDTLDCVRQPVAFRKLINFAEAEPVYPEFLTAKDLVRFIGKTKGATAANIQSTIQHFGVNTFYEKATGTFSSGMLKKLCLTLAFLGSPKLIILDEPLITLDEQARVKLVQLIKDYVNRGVMFLISSHQLIDSSLTLSAVFEIKSKSIHVA